MEGGKYAKQDKDYPLAQYLYEQALSLIPKDSVVETYVAYNNLRDICRLRAHYRDAVSHGLSCIELMRPFGENGKIRLMEDYAMLANIYTEMKDSTKAYCYLDSACLIIASPDVNMAYKKKFATIAGTVYAHLDDWSKAEDLYHLAVNYSKRYPKSNDTQLTLNLYGNSLFQNGKYNEALKIYEEQKSMCDELFGKDSREYQWANYCVANILAYMGKIGEGTAIYKEVIDWYRTKILDDLSSLPATQREMYLDNMINIIQNAIPFGIEAKYNEDIFTQLAYEGLLLSKGLLLATDKSTDAIIRGNGTPEEIASLNHLKELRSLLAELCNKPDSDPKDILNTYAEIKGIDFDLAKVCAKYGNNTSFGSVGYDNIKNSLAPNEVLLDFADFKPLSKPRQYVCFEIRKDQKHPKIHYICNEAELDSLLVLENYQWGNLYTAETGVDMKKIIADPLKEIIGNSTKVYYVPSGIFHKLAIEAIQYGDSRLGDVCNFSRISSARELLKKDTSSTPLSAYLYGGLNYDGLAKPLPRSLEGVTEIAQILSDASPLKVMTADDGTEDSFISMNGNSPKILHMSTHGFYNALEEETSNSLKGYNDAMVRSGLIMSGGQPLTAETISHCDLSSTDLTSLASCYSGQGEVTSEGIYGLQRAFKKAGVGSILISLWQASDVATKHFMTSFYEDLVNGSKDRHKAFLYARDKVRKLYPSPFYWAGFIMID